LHETTNLKGKRDFGEKNKLSTVDICVGTSKILWMQIDNGLFYEKTFDMVNYADIYVI